MDDDYDDDEYAPIGEADEAALFADPQDGPGLFDLDEPADDPAPSQDGPDLFGDEPDTQRARVAAAAMRPAREDEPDDHRPAEESSGDDASTGSGQAVASGGSSSSSQGVTQRRPEPEPAPLALYRRYRPDTFADVIGQEHVTDPLQRALINNRVNHAYLFSGPRGCGKTSSARILARCLNCEQGPTATPCGVCQSCTDLARGGPGSIDVIEIDAASHGGVDDARDLRERAFFAPVNSRYKIYIVDEAHMVTTAGFNALLKLVEEPPPHVKFIFATTEPEKVIGTIRSRTHHYPFRLVPPRVLTDYLARLCEAEGVQVEPAVLPLIVRAGAGSVRDSLSVLDQLLGAATDRGVEYGQAAALLGYTPDALLDEMVDGFAAGDSSAVFATIDKVIEVGQDPRRFAEDLLRRLRDLIIVSAVPEAASIGLLDIPDDQAQRYATQAAGMGRGELTRAAEVLAAGLTEMRGTTAPRLHLELMCARVLLPGADVDERGVHARLDRLERRVGMLADAPDAPEWSDATVVRPGGEVRPGVRPESRADGRAEGRVGSVGGGERQATRPGDRSSGLPVEQRTATRGVAPDVPAQQRPAGRSGERPAGVPVEQRPRDVPAQQRPAKRPEAVPERAEVKPPEPVAGQRPDTVAGQRPAAEQASPAARPTERPAQPPQAAANPAPAPRSSARELTAVQLRSVWPRVLEKVKDRRRYTWMILNQHVQIADATSERLTLAFSNVGARDNFGQRGSIDILRDVLIDEIGADLQIVMVLSDGSGEEGPHQRPAGRPPVPTTPEDDRPAASAPPSPATPPPPDEDAWSDDDEVIVDEGLSVAELLAKELGAEVIHEEPLP